jgi:hypothetical protein
MVKGEKLIGKKKIKPLTKENHQCHFISSKSLFQSLFSTHNKIYYNCLGKGKKERDIVKILVNKTEEEKIPNKHTYKIFFPS